MRPYATSNLQVYADLMQQCVRPYATSVFGLTLPGDAAFRYLLVHAGLMLLVYAALSY